MFAGLSQNYYLIKYISHLNLLVYLLKKFSSQIINVPFIFFKFVFNLDRPEFLIFYPKSLKLFVFLKEGILARFPRILFKKLLLKAVGGFLIRFNFFGAFSKSCHEKIFFINNHLIFPLCFHSIRFFTLLLGILDRWWTIWPRFRNIHCFYKFII